MATKYKPFLFDRSFDELDEAGGGRARPANSDRDDPATAEAEDARGADGEAATTEDPPPPAYSEEELEAARTAAYEEGRREGLEAGRKEVLEDVEAHLADALDALAAQIGPLAARQKEANERAGALSAKIARDIFERLMPAYAARYGDEEVVRLVTESLASLQDVGKLTVRAPERLAEPLRGRLEEVVRNAGFEGKLSIVGDPDMGPSDAAVDWGSGGAERRYADIWAAIEGAVNRAVADLGPTEEAPPEPASHDAATDGPGEDSPAADGPGTDGPGADGPGADGPAADGPAADGPAAEARQTAEAENDAVEPAVETDPSAHER
ncbi:MAG: hypothetical protein NXI21_11290 [Alphaproteobacteria bacterium]|nr:hypothetical protein [Alphaproteobacteria bacterium]